MRAEDLRKAETVSNSSTRLSFTGGQVDYLEVYLDEVDILAANTCIDVNRKFSVIEGTGFEVREGDVERLTDV